jgi:hypothetical protein
MCVSEPCPDDVATKFLEAIQVALVVLRNESHNAPGFNQVMDDAVQTAMGRQFEKWMKPYQKYLTLGNCMSPVQDNDILKEDNNNE